MNERMATKGGESKISGGAWPRLYNSISWLCLLEKDWRGCHAQRAYRKKKVKPRHQAVATKTNSSANLLYECKSCQLKQQIISVDGNVAQSQKEVTNSAFDEEYLANRWYLRVGTQTCRFGPLTYRNDWSNGPTGFYSRSWVRKSL